ncbi:MAG: dihydrofolate reductase family protein [Candidatus Hodarchaeales archaeon]|jgi:2,5-diamino-6-(ribosylamino)-4(3H)-pyrimidinone 5'-phosphate reductase
MTLNRVETTLFSLISVDGKINTGDIDARDTEIDYPRIHGVKEGLHQYYELEEQLDPNSLSTGRIMAKIGINDRKKDPEKIPWNFIIIDRKPHLKESGIVYLTKWVQKLYLVTNNEKHPAFNLKQIENLEIIYYLGEIDLEELFVRLKQKKKIDKLSLQTGGDLTSVLMKKKLIDHISIVIAPVLIGGQNTNSLVDGVSPRTEQDLKNIKALKFKKCNFLKDSYLHLYYDVLNETEIN